MRNRNKNTFERSSTMISKPPVHLAQYAKTLNLKSHLIYLSCYLGERASHGVLLQLLFLTSIHLLHLVHAPPPVPSSYVVLHRSSHCPFDVSFCCSSTVTHVTRWQVSHQSSWRPLCGYLLFSSFFSHHALVSGHVGSCPCPPWMSSMEVCLWCVLMFHSFAVLLSCCLLLLISFLTVAFLGYVPPPFFLRHTMA